MAKATPTALVIRLLATLAVALAMVLAAAAVQVALGVLVGWAVREAQAGLAAAPQPQVVREAGHTQRPLAGLQTPLEVLLTRRPTTV